MIKKDFFRLWVIVSSTIIFIIFFNFLSDIIKNEQDGDARRQESSISEQSQQTDSGTRVSQIPLYAEPTANFKARITKKPFGLYMTPQNSPIKPERFTGYHTGVDVEYEDVTGDVPVYALEAGEIMISRVASGYGGVFLMSFDLNGSKHTAVYGHIRPSTLPKAGTNFNKGQQMAVLGTGYGAETDGERRHLHFGILVDSGADLRGYVQTKQELAGWLDPLSLYK